jgi:hypothetical protein
MWFHGSPRERSSRQKACPSPSWNCSSRAARFPREWQIRRSIEAPAGDAAVLDSGQMSSRHLERLAGPDFSAYLHRRFINQWESISDTQIWTGLWHCRAGIQL